YITSLLGDVGIPVSRVGNDELGREVQERLAQLGLRAIFIQQDRTHPTGTVNVVMNDGQMNDGQHRFEIRENVAWDFLEFTEVEAQLAAMADAVCFGSLAQRSSKSRSTILRFLQATRAEAVRVFDVNLRQNFYSKEILDQSMKLATIVKLNHEELPKIMRLFEIEMSTEQDAARKLLVLHGVKLVCVTRGAAGSLLISGEECSEHPGFKVKVADTVGAGDAFTAALVHGYLRGMSLAEINEKANRVGAWVASQSGAMPNIGRESLPQILQEI
ncbi:MAG: carbohydrate kinase, partial [Candidatus Sulfotelmatobacter sp.]